ncbi:MAG: hypothetical protein ABS84_07280 [Rubrivivax sp. SCN 71-131]|jgi:aminoglycoside/choline kinase family phosphotransferase|nr:MAG: hypothetical protein ABS84_07280 [Rubrivivax sp. SCN 71-131]
MHHDDPAERQQRLRAAVQALQAWQAAAHDALRDEAQGGGLPRLDEPALRAALALFLQACAQPTGAARPRGLDRALDLLVSGALAQPAVALRRAWPAAAGARGDGPPAADAASGPAIRPTLRGPWLFDLAGLLMDPSLACGEEERIDAAVRWWQQARRSAPALGQALAEDFGECWRALEWTALLQQLQRIGALCAQAQDEGLAPHTAALAPLARTASGIALRYAPLAPLLVLLEPFAGQGLSRGFTF